MQNHKVHLLSSTQTDEEIDPRIWQKASVKNNSGYLPEQYQISPDFPTLPDYHFRVEDAETILQLQKLQMQQQNTERISDPSDLFQGASHQFKKNLKTLIGQLDKAQSAPAQGIYKAQKHGFYSLEKQFDEKAALNEAFTHLQAQQTEKKMGDLSLYPKKGVEGFLKSAKKSTNNMVAQEKENELKKMNRQFKKLSITEEDL